MFFIAAYPVWVRDNGKDMKCICPCKSMGNEIFKIFRKKWLLAMFVIIPLTCIQFKNPFDGEV